MPTVLAGQSGPAIADPAYLAAHESERARVLRRRMVWCLGILLALVAISALGTMFEYQEYRAGTTPLELVVLDGLDDLCLASLLIATLLYVLGIKPDRRRLVKAIAVSTITTMAAATFFEIRRSLLEQTDFLGHPVPGADPHVFACRWGVFCHGLIVWIALLVIPMRWAESLRIVIGCGVVYAGLVAAESGASARTQIAYDLLALAAPLPAALFSWWRYQQFDAQFEHAHLKGRYGELSAELSQARKLHEAFFPPPIDAGPVRVWYAYEPMREIGGDFLFIHGRPDAGATAAPADSVRASAPVYILLVDVSGHGVTSALAVNRIHGELTRLFAAAGAVGSAAGVGGTGGSSLSAAKVITALNAYVSAVLAPQGVFATAICLRVTPSPTGAAIEWSSAGHPPAFLRSRSGANGSEGGGSVHRLGPNATMLGVLEPDLYHAGEGKIEAAPCDVIVAYTDGLAEARSHENAEFGVDRIEQIIAAHAPAHGAPASRIAQSLANAAAEHRAGRITDDTLVVEVEIAEPVTESKMRQRTIHAEKSE